MRLEVCPADELPPGAMKGVALDGERRIVVANVDGELRAFGGICSHAYAELDRGRLVDDAVMCPLHFSEFDTRTGEALNPPAVDPVPVYAVKVEAGTVVVELPDGPARVPGAETPK